MPPHVLSAALVSGAVPASEVLPLRLRRRLGEERRGPAPSGPRPASPLTATAAITSASLQGSRAVMFSMP